MINIEQYIIPILDQIIDVLAVWWWVFPPVILYFVFRSFYLFWVNWEIFYKEIDWVILEVVPPAIIEKPYLAMEDIFNKLWGIYDGPNWRGYWCEGMFYMPSWFSIEIISIGGNIHYLFRIPNGFQTSFETTIHTHYPDADIFEVEDYTQNIPKDIPNQKYDFYAEDYKYFYDWVFPIKTYKSFESTNTQNLEGSQKIEPFNSLMESMVKIKPGEQYWLQIIATPIINSDKEIPWQDKCQEKANELAHRDANAGKSGGYKFKSIGGEAFRAVVHGTVPFSDPIEKEKALETFPTEMKLTPVEKDKLMAVESKLTKRGFKVSMRSFYFYERDRYFGPNKGIAVSYFGHFSVENLNFIMFWNKTRPRVHYFYKKRREYSRKMNLWRRYERRFPPMYPNLIDGTSVMNSEELATIFHFPGDADLLPAGVPRISARKSDAPLDIPMDTGDEEDNSFDLPIEDFKLEPSIQTPEISNPSQSITESEKKDEEELNLPFE